MVTVIIPKIHSSSNFYLKNNENENVGFRVVQFEVKGTNIIAKVRSYLTGYLCAVKNELSLHEYDVLNVHYLPALFSLRSILNELKVCYTFHGPWSSEMVLSYSGRMDSKSLIGRFLYRICLEPIFQFIATSLERQTLKRIGRFFVLSQYMADVLYYKFQVGRNQIMKAPAGVDHSKFFPGVNNQLRQAWSNEESVVFITIRRLEKRMGLDILIKALVLLRARHKEFTLVIGGKGPHENYLKSLVSHYGLDDQIKFVGFVPEEMLRDYIASADLFVLPSRDLEGFGLVVLESFACGTPILVSPYGGPKEVVSDFDSDFVLDSLSPEDLSNQLFSLIASGKLGRLRAVSTKYSRSFTWSNFSEIYIEWLKK
jgi:glycosyltransferase involved in cell wall biosynthesis